MRPPRLSASNKLTKELTRDDSVTIPATSSTFDWKNKLQMFCHVHAEQIRVFFHWAEGLQAWTSLDWKNKTLPWSALKQMNVIVLGNDLAAPTANDCAALLLPSPALFMSSQVPQDVSSGPALILRLYWLVDQKLTCFFFSDEITSQWNFPICTFTVASSYLRCQK